MKLLMAVVLMVAMLAFGGSVHAVDLHDAAASGDQARVKEALKAGADVNAKNKHGNTLLHFMAKPHARPKIAKVLLDDGAEVNAKNKHGATPLHLALKRGHAVEARMLLNAGADLNAKDKDGRTPCQLDRVGLFVPGSSTLICR